MEHSVLHNYECQASLKSNFSAWLRCVSSTRVRGASGPSQKQEGQCQVGLGVPPASYGLNYTTNKCVVHKQENERAALTTVARWPERDLCERRQWRQSCLGGWGFRRNNVMNATTVSIVNEAAWKFPSQALMNIKHTYLALKTHTVPP
jgi:hypothetical protein